MEGCTAIANEGKRRKGIGSVNAMQRKMKTKKTSDGGVDDDLLFR